MELLGAHEIRLMLGDITRQRAYQITSKPSFPPPIAELEQGKIWNGQHVRQWIAEHRRPTRD